MMKRKAKEEDATNLPIQTSRTWLETHFGLVEPVCDDDGFYGGALHPRDQSRIVQAMGWWALGTGVQGIVMGNPLLGGGVLVGACIAAAYWQNPCIGWRRNLDMTWIQVLLWSHLISAITSPVRGIYYAICAGGAIFYGLSWWLLKQGDSWGSILCHMGLTACANLSLNVLYAFPLSLPF